MFWRFEASFLGRHGKAKALRENQIVLQVDEEKIPEVLRQYLVYLKRSLTDLYAGSYIVKRHTSQKISPKQYRYLQWLPHFVLRDIKIFGRRFLDMSAVQFETSNWNISVRIMHEKCHKITINWFLDLAVLIYNHHLLVKKIN